MATIPGFPRVVGTGIVDNTYFLTIHFSTTIFHSYIAPDAFYLAQVGRLVG